MPGKVVQVLVEPGAAVAAGQPLLVLEAMKMEHTLSAPTDGTVAAVRYAAGDLVEEGVELVEFEAGGNGAAA
jgi:3-methylcrotonyl-CoA carboxylase alpha subunit